MVEIELKFFKNSFFHFSQLRQSISVGSYIDIIVNSGWVDFLVFAGNPQACNTCQLILFFDQDSLGLKYVEIAEC